MSLHVHRISRSLSGCSPLQQLRAPKRRSNRWIEWQIVAYGDGRHRQSFSTITTNYESPPTLTLYQYAICPFCNHTKALLAYANIPYEAIEVNPLTKDELKWSKDYRKVPIAVLDGQALYGSDQIIHGLLHHDAVIQNLQSRWASHHHHHQNNNNNNHSNDNMSLAEFQSSPSALQWTAFARDELAPLLYPNLCNTLENSYRAFNYVWSVENQFSTLQKYMIQSLGSIAMYLAASKIKRTYGMYICIYIYTSHHWSGNQSLLFQRYIL